MHCLRDARIAGCPDLFLHSWTRSPCRGATIRRECSVCVGNIITATTMGLLQSACGHRKLTPHSTGLHCYRGATFVGRMKDNEVWSLRPDAEVVGAELVGGHWMLSALGSGTRSCPGCGVASTSRHSWNDRQLQDFRG